MTRILVVDDDPPISRALAMNFRARGFETDVAATGEIALTLAAQNMPDAVVLDLGLPGIGGIDVIKRLRGWSAVPVIILSVREGVADKVAALDAGADDYVTKPFGMDELVARLRAALRRSPDPEERDTIETDDFRLEFAARRARAGTSEVHLTRTEWQILEVLVRERGRLVTQRRLLHEVWGPAHVDDTAYLRVHLAHIRRKLEPDPSRPRYIVTEHGMGYRLEH